MFYLRLAPIMLLFIVPLATMTKSLMTLGHSTMVTGPLTHEQITKWLTWEVIRWHSSCRMDLGSDGEVLIHNKNNRNEPQRPIKLD